MRDAPGTAQVEVRAEPKVLVNRPPGRFSTRANAIRAQCLGCGGGPKEVALCPCTTCPLWPWRFGSGARARRIVEQERQAGIGPGETHWAERVRDYVEQSYYVTERRQRGR